MEPFTTHTGRAVPLPRSDVDTDQIIPSDYLKRVSRTGFADGLFAAWRGPGFPLDDPAYASATILLTGDNFGCGSSREHAVWALQDAGFRAVIGPGFADIFRGNALKNGLLPVTLAEPVVAQLIAAVTTDPTAPLTVDLAARHVAGAGVTASFEIDEHTRWRLLEGLDDITLTLRHADEITAYEAPRPGWLPTTA